MRNPSQTAASGDSGVSSSEGGSARHVGSPVNPPLAPEVFDEHARGHGRGPLNPPHPHVAGDSVNPDVRESQARDPVNPPSHPDVFPGHAGGHGRGPMNPSPAHVGTGGPPMNPPPSNHVFQPHAGGPVNPDVRGSQVRDPVNPPPSPNIFGGHAGGPVNPDVR